MGFPIKSGGQRSITIGGYTFDWDPINNPNDIQLSGSYGGSTNISSGLRTLIASSGYLVPVGRRLVVVAVKVFSSSTGGTSCYLAQVDNDVAVNSAGAPTNPLYFGSGSSSQLTPTVVTTPNAGGAAEVGGLNFPIATGKYGYIRSTGGATDYGSATLYCKLV